MPYHLRQCLPIRGSYHSAFLKQYYGLVLELGRSLSDAEFQQVMDYWRRSR